MALEICRVCGTTTGDLKNILSGGNDELVEQMRLCANIQIDIYDNLPKFVCKQCEDGLAFSYRLRKRGEETEKKLREDFLLTSIEPFTLGNESFVQTQNDCMMVEFCDDEIWEKDEKDVYCEEDVLIDRASDSNEELSQDLHEDPDNENDNWASLENEFYTENAYIENTVEIIENTVIEPIEEVSIELIEANEEFTVEQNETIETEVTYNSKLKKHDFVCEICHEVFERKSQYRKHTKLHEEQRFYCDLCDQWFAFGYIFEDHLKNHFPSEKSFTCRHCDKIYTHQGNMERHIRSAHNRERKFQCTECGDTFGRPDILKMHMAKHNENRTIECNVCKKRFKTNQSLHYHLKSHENKTNRHKKTVRLKAKPKPKMQYFFCEQCDKISHHRTTHLNHIRIHTGEKPFKCRTCDKAFRTTHARTNHELLHTDIRPYECKVCGTAFRQTSHLKSHMLIHTGDKRHVCEFCDKAFTMRSNLVVHLRMHTGEKPYKCNKCPKKFLLSSQFKRHEMSHISGNHLPSESSKENGIEILGEFHDSQISLYIDKIVEENAIADENIVVVS